VRKSQNSILMKAVAVETHIAASFDRFLVQLATAIDATMLVALAVVFRPLTLLAMAHA
jgi:hypothetical protein